MRVPLSRPDINDADRAAVMDVLQGSQLSMGPYLEKFERQMAALSGNRYAVAVNSGTSGLHLSLLALGVGAGDGVVTTPFSFVASSNVVIMAGARPVFVDIDEDRMDMPPEAVAEVISTDVRAILPVDVFGQPAQLRELRSLADRHGLVVLEDSCESLGAEHLGSPAGHPDFAHAAVFAFYPNKQMTTGEGGVVVTSDVGVAELCRSLRNQGRGESGHWLVHERLGYNYRLDEMSAALGYSQSLRLSDLLTAREQVAARYDKSLADIPGVRVPRVAPETSRMSWFVYVVRLDAHIDRDRVLVWLNEEGVQCRPYFTPIHLQPFYRREFGYRPGDFPVTERVASSTIALPFCNDLSAEEMGYVADRLRRAIELFGS